MRRPTGGPAPRLRLAVLLVSLVGALWALVTPLAGVPDEPAHVLYAAGVVRGQVGDGPTGTEVAVPAGVSRVTQATCYAFRPVVTADCVGDVSGERRTTTVTTSAAHYPPLYYALVGWPSLVTFGEGTWYLMRLLSVLLGAGLLLAGASAWRRDPAVLPVGLLLAVTPMAAFLLGSVNPNGAEVMAGVALVLGGTGLLDRVRHGEALDVRAVLVALVLPTGYLCLARPGSFVLAVALLGVLTVLGLGQARALAGQGRVLGVAAAGGLLAVATAYVQSLLLDRPVGTGGGAGSSLVTSLVIVLDQGVARTLETVGYLGWRDHAPPQALRLTWLALVFALLLAAWFAGRPVQRLALLLLVLGAVVLVPTALVLTVFLGSEGYQARYAMAVLQPVPVLAAAVLATAGRPTGLALRVLGAAPVGTLAIGLLVLGGSLLRYAVGLPLPYDPLRVLRGWVWTPPTWPLALLVLAAAVLVAVRLRTALLSDDDREPVPAPA